MFILRFVVAIFELFSSFEIDFSQLETSAEIIQKNMGDVDEYLTHRRLREAGDRKFAEDLNEQVTWWSIGQSVFMIFIGLGQVWVLRSFFTDKSRTHA